MKKYLAIFLLMLVVPLTISAQQTITVTGTVTDTQDEPMIGVNITVKDVAGLGTITDINGNFSIKMEPYHRLVFSYIGYDDVEVLVKEQHTVNVKMKESEASVLDEVVVTGMGAQKKLTVTGAVTNVNVGDLKRFPTSNMSNALAGNVPGIIARQTSGQPGKSTRGLSDEGEFQVNDLYVLIFNANNDQARKTGGGYYNSDLIKNVITGNQANGKVSSGTLTLKTTSGESLIYAVANVKGNDLGGDITAALENVNSLADFKKLSVALTIKANVERSSPALVMSGAYIDGSTQPQTGYCNIPAQSTTLSGKISLTRLDSHIIFKITPNMQANGGKIKTFTPKSWRVYNVPNKSYIVAQDADAVGNTAEDYENTESSIRFGEQTDNIYDFDFYMLENRKNAKTYEGRSIENYKQREEEVKTNEHKNTGEYKYVEPYATFVEIKAHMEIENADNDNGIRVADVTYVIHLGYVDNVAADFKNERNKKYTYNVTINNVEDIVTEVTEEGNPENTPGAEGDIVDSQTTVYNLDAHYGYLILKFKYSEVKDGLQFYVKTPFGETNNDDKSVVGHDCKWLRFARCNNESTLANYPKDGKGLINLFELKADIEDQYQKDTNKDNTYYYTVFVDEYFYENNPLETSSNNNWGNENWEEFVNKDDRYALLIFSPQKSPDGESSYASAKYMITQKSIQTYYSTEKFNSDKTALGMEHIDETGVPNGWESGSYGSSQENGYKNTYPVVNNTNISSYGTETLSNGKNTFTINDAANAIQACMARNRDENNDGKISGS